MENFPGEIVAIPLNWSFHSDTGDDYDFGENRPETNLKKLVTICQELNKKLVFFLFISPMPFVPNGGIPHFLARNASLSLDGLLWSQIDSEGQVHTMYSFFDQRVFKAFRKFAFALNDYFVRQDIRQDLWAAEAGYFQNGDYHSLLEDRSIAFDQAFTRYLEMQKRQDPAWIIKDAEHEMETRNIFSRTIKDLYLETTQAAIRNLEGTLRFAFLGSGQIDFFQRASGADKMNNYIADVFYSICHEVIPSSILLSSSYVNNFFKLLLKDNVTDLLFPMKLLADRYEDEGAVYSVPLVFFKIHHGKYDENRGKYWDCLNLRHFLHSNYRWMYNYFADRKSLQDDFREREDQVYFFFGKDLTSDDFIFLLKIFLNGGQVIFDTSNLADNLRRRLESFILENNLANQEVNYYGKIVNFTLGNGRLMIFNGDDFTKLGEKELGNFWQQVLKTFELKHMMIPLIEGVDFFWKTRSSNTNELKFEEIRRLSIYNTTSYKKKFSLRQVKNFVLTKIIDQQNSHVITGPGEINLELLPSGSVSLDFGIFS